MTASIPPGNKISCCSSAFPKGAAAFFRRGFTRNDICTVEKRL